MQQHLDAPGHPDGAVGVEPVQSLRRRQGQRGPATVQFFHEEIGQHDHQQVSAGARLGAYADGVQLQFRGLAAAKDLVDFGKVLVAVMHGFFAGPRRGCGWGVWPM